MRELAGARVLVTGAGGFIGANLVRALLAESASVAAVVRPGGDRSRLAEIEDVLETMAVDVRVPGALDDAVGRACPDFAVHLAFAGGHPATSAERLEQLQLSVLGTARLLEALAGSSCSRLVHVGSSLEYGPSPTPMRETDLLSPTLPRGAAKAAATLVCLAWSRTLGIPAYVLRPFSVYGPWEDDSRLVPRALRAALDGAPLPLTAPGFAHDLLYVGDLVGAILRALAVPEVTEPVVNVGSGVQTTNEELVAAVGRAVGRDVVTIPGEYPAAPHDSTTWVADVELALQVLGWAPSVTLEDGLRRTLAWLEDRSGVVRS
jgi:nucleoside-diphosphate-sugar epimerase